MDAKTLSVLEYPKILSRLADFCDFSASAELARALAPTPDFDEACERLAGTSEARKLLSINDLTIGGAKQAPSLTGYCRSTKQFVRVQLKSWDDYRKSIPNSPDCPEPILPIYDGSQISKIPCPKCGNLTLGYQRRLMFD